MVQPLVMILISLIGAYLLSQLLKRMGVPTAVGQIVAGLILGISAIKAYLFTGENLNLLSFLANLGVILLFYYVGLETNLMLFTRHLKKSALISVFNTFLPLLLGFAVMKFLFQLSTLVSIIVGVSLSVSAQSISLSMLNELKLVKSKIGNMIITAGAVDDILELLMATVLLSLFHITLTKLTFSRFLLDIALFILIVVVARLWLIPYTLRLFDREKSTTIRFMGSLIILLVIASLSEWLGVGLLIGAMVAGMIIRQTIAKDSAIPNWEEHDIAKSIHIIAFGFLIPLFFVWIGINTNVALILENIGLIVLLFLLATIGTVGGTIIAVVLGRGSIREGLLLGWGLNPKGDIELIVAALALQTAIITEDIFTALVMMSLLTTLISPIIFRRLVYAYHKVKTG